MTAINRSAQRSHVVLVEQQPAVASNASNASASSDSLEPASRGNVSAEPKSQLQSQLQQPQSQQSRPSVLMVQCPPKVNFAGTRYSGTVTEIKYVLPDQHVELVGSDVVIPYEVKLAQRVFDVQPGTITVTTEHGIEIRPRIVVTPDIINIAPAHVEDLRKGVRVSQPQVECECAPGENAPAQQSGAQPAEMPGGGSASAAH